jgi:hypothetical protein
MLIETFFVTLCNLTDKQWQVTEIILDPQQRKRKYPLREIMNAIMYAEWIPLIIFDKI